MLTSMFNNAGNLGLPVSLFAFGETALAYATLYFVTVSTLNNTVGVVIASLGSTNIKQAVLGLFRVPALYSILLAFIIINQGWHLPLFLERSVGLAANAAIPLMLVLLGLQFQNIRWAGHGLPLGVTNIIRLLVSPVIALVLSPVFGLAGVSRQAGILESAMPAAVLTTVIATEFNIEPAFVTAAVFTSTLLSPLTLTLLLAYLK
jgi:predicted permease